MLFAQLSSVSHHAAWRRQLELLLESAGEGIYGIDLRGRCIFINRAGAAMLGYTPDELVGRNMHYLIHHSHTDGRLRPVHDCRIFRAFQEGMGCQVDDECLWRRDGSWFAAEYASYPIREQDDVVGAVVTFRDITERKRIAAELQLAHDRLEQRVAERTAELSEANARLEHVSHDLRRLSAHLHRIRETERWRVARDVHDDLGAALTAIQLELTWLEQRVGDDELRERLKAARAISQDAMTAVRRILNDLRPGVLDHLGLWAAIESLLSDVGQRGDLTCLWICPPEVERCRLGRDAEIAVYRIVQEALTNVQKHAAAQRVEVKVWLRGGAITLEVVDDGKGYVVAERPHHFGLLGMSERARALGGELKVNSELGQGTKLTLRLPGVASGAWG